jgi:hypothetical protein
MGDEIGTPPISLELVIRMLLRDTPFEPSVNLKVYDSYVKGFSKTAYIHKDVMVRLGLSNTDDDNIIEIETKSGKRTVVNVLELGG